MKIRGVGTGVQAKTCSTLFDKHSQQASDSTGFLRFEPPGFETIVSTLSTLLQTALTSPTLAIEGQLLLEDELHPLSALHLLCYGGEL